MAFIYGHTTNNGRRSKEASASTFWDLIMLPIIRWLDKLSGRACGLRLAVGWLRLNFTKAGFAHAL